MIYPISYGPCKPVQRRRFFFAVAATYLQTDTPRELELFYDGVRRIKERYYVDPDIVEDPLEGGLLGMMALLGDFGEIEGWCVETDYVWGPDYVDELAFLVNDSNAARYAIQDANYNVMGWSVPNGTLNTNYVYGPYGDLRIVEYRNPSTPPPLALGHQGLFFVRLDGEADDPPLTVGAKGLYYNRNRWYSPELGRFTTRDVNETALPILALIAKNGESIDVLLKGFEQRGSYAEGMNLHNYAGSNPINRRDPIGLFGLGFSDILTGAGNNLSRMSTAYDIADRSFEFVAGILTGIGIQQLVLGVATEMVTDAVGGKLFDAAINSFKMAARFIKGHKFRDMGSYRKRYEAMFGNLPEHVQVHHLIPQDFRDTCLTKVVPPIDIDDPAFLYALEDRFHTWVHAGSKFDFNGKWKQFFDKFVDQDTISAESVLRFLQNISGNMKDAL